MLLQIYRCPISALHLLCIIGILIHLPELHLIYRLLICLIDRCVILCRTEHLNDHDDIHRYDKYKIKRYGQLRTAERKEIIESMQKHGRQPAQPEIRALFLLVSGHFIKFRIAVEESHIYTEGCMPGDRGHCPEKSGIHSVLDHVNDIFYEGKPKRRINGIDDPVKGVIEIPVSPGRQTQSQIFPCFLHRCNSQKCKNRIIRNGVVGMHDLRDHLHRYHLKNQAEYNGNRTENGTLEKKSRRFLVMFVLCIDQQHDYDGRNDRHHDHEPG